MIIQGKEISSVYRGSREVIEVRHLSDFVFKQIDSSYTGYPTDIMGNDLYTFVSHYHLYGGMYWGLNYIDASTEFGTNNTYGVLFDLNRKLDASVHTHISVEWTNIHETTSSGSNAPGVQIVSQSINGMTNTPDIHDKGLIVLSSGNDSHSGAYGSSYIILRENNVFNESVKHPQTSASVVRETNEFTPYASDSSMWSPTILNAPRISTYNNNPWYVDGDYDADVNAPVCYEYPSVLPSTTTDLEFKDYMWDIATDSSSMFYRKIAGPARSGNYNYTYTAPVARSYSTSTWARNQLYPADSSIGNIVAYSSTYNATTEQDFLNAPATGKFDTMMSVITEFDINKNDSDLNTKVLGVSDTYINMKYNPYPYQIVKSETVTPDSLATSQDSMYLIDGDPMTSIFDVKWYEDNVLKMHLVPCLHYDDSMGKYTACFYDTVSHTYKYNTYFTGYPFAPNSTFNEHNTCGYVLLSKEKYDELVAQFGQVFRVSKETPIDTIMGSTYLRGKVVKVY
jgi:hypothetical protein